MLTILFVFVAFAFGIMLFTSIQEKIPEELAWLRSSNVYTNKDGSTRTSYNGWKITQAKDTVELYKDFKGPFQVNGTTYKAPAIGILCHDNKLDLRLLTNEATTGVSSTEVFIGPVRQTQWAKGNSTNIFPADSYQTLKEIVKHEGLVDFQLSYRDLGLQKVSLDTKGLKELVVQFPKGCLPS